MWRVVTHANKPKREITNHIWTITTNRPPESKWEVITMDFGLPLPETKNGNSGILNVVFMSKFWKALFKSLGTKLAPSTAYRPQTDGQSEIANRKVEEMIRGFANYKKDNWYEQLVEFEVAHSSAVIRQHYVVYSSSAMESTISWFHQKVTSRTIQRRSHSLTPYTTRPNSSMIVSSSKTGNGTVCQ